MEFYLYILKCNVTSRLEVLAAERKIKKWTRQKKERLIMFGWSGFLK
ncbi:MAG: hypothetical protein US32_C0019G0027 [candidate division TM6 bacterium GW2011_GWA2_36_9]|nr:MAG: hypothetical protein US32_C0019G0027 [candidate division TM6 bacterium GW2011_GWA2_36_9]